MATVNLDKVNALINKHYTAGLSESESVLLDELLKEEGFSQTSAAMYIASLDPMESKPNQDGIIVEY